MYISLQKNRRRRSDIQGAVGVVSCSLVKSRNDLCVTLFRWGPAHDEKVTRSVCVLGAGSRSCVCVYHVLYSHPPSTLLAYGIDSTAAAAAVQVLNKRPYTTNPRLKMLLVGHHPPDGGGCCCCVSLVPIDRLPLIGAVGAPSHWLFRQHIHVIIKCRDYFEGSNFLKIYVFFFF